MPAARVPKRLTNTIDLRILHRMKVTAILPDDLVADVQKYSGGKNITDSLSLALTEWLRLAKVRKLNQKLERTPLKFQQGFSAEKVRALNRKVT